MTGRPRLTPHQAEVLKRLRVLSARVQNGRTWIAASTIGSRTALEHLVRKGYAERLDEIGPRGGTHRYYRPTSHERSTP